ncbi:cysteine proteinase [Polyporus arcularius HHB13444]|uniref:ubiquitinyl hydrolase 1 n=1 Tax=Polyporus arcularius HHB13444 TaxID=1314778 RepID=A0A5C3Q2W9_9APHY|nr:cysteine proteinase [Polyporus arcularius HHB13444]
MNEDSSTRHDLVGGPFAVIESDPGVFTTLLHKLGIRGLEVTELYSVEAFATDHLNPYGLIFCYLCEDSPGAQDDTTISDDLEDPDARAIWFANQLSDDACSSQAILNVLLNCKGVDIGSELREFAADTEKMSPVMRGLAISNSSHIRQAQNSLARPADIRGAYHTLAATTLDAAKASAKAASSPPTKKRKTSASTTSRAKRKATSTERLEAYHFIGYVPAHGRVWELDGLRAAGPLDVGEIQSDSKDPDSRAGWMDIVRPALQRRMQTVLEGGSGEGHIQYNLLAIVDDAYLGASDDLELLKRERAALERRLDENFPAGWADKVDPALLAAGTEAFATTLRPSAREPGRVFAADFGSRKMSKELVVLDMAARSLAPAWENCVRAALSAKVAVEDEVARSQSAQADNVKRTFDYEPFIREFVTSLQNEGLLEDALKGPSPAGNGEPATPSKKSRTRKK